MRGSFSFKIEIVDKLFDTGVNKYNQTARVLFVDNQANVQLIFEYGVLQKEDLYKMIDEKKPINIDLCYIQNFSLEEYRLLRGISDEVRVDLIDFSAKKTFFEADDTTNFSLAHFIGNEVSFKNTYFGNGNVSFLKSKFDVLKKTDFSYAFFGKGQTNFQYASFGDANISFENSINTGDLFFVNANFGHGKVSFKNVSFGDGLVDFHYSKFGNGFKSFYKSSFDGETIDFRRVEFGDGKIDFRRVEFGDANVLFDECEAGMGRMSFKRSIFGEGKLSFTLLNFKDEITFENAEFKGGNMSFFQSNLTKLSFKSCHLNNYLDLRVRYCHTIDLSDTVIRDILDFKKGLSVVNVKELKIIGLRNLGKIILDWRENKVEELIEHQTANVFEKSEQYRILKENFRNTGQYNDEDEAYVKFKRYELKYLHNERIKKGGVNKVTAYPIKWGKELLFDKMGNYATSPLRVLFSMFVIYVLFSFLFLLMIHTGHGDLKPGFDPPEQMSEITLSFYHSAITLLTIGYGDYSPWGIIRFISSLEGFVGLFMMSYFTVAFVRKILR
ncbi:MAG TPA: two pore domain potassium channel family protein [Crocinitomix sp.]|nr:two pore domain potassium channel family protein [Crocinitomix sp.]